MKYGLPGVLQNFVYVKASRYAGRILFSSAALSGCYFVMKTHCAICEMGTGFVVLIGLLFRLPSGFSLYTLYTFVTVTS